MTKMNKMLEELSIARMRVINAKELMMDTNTSSIFWNKLDTIQADLEASIKMLWEIEDAK